MREVLMVAEKPNLAQTLSTLLSGDRARKGCIDKRMKKGLPLYEWDAPWPMTGEIVHYKMTSTYGHVNEIEFEHEFLDWRKDPEGLFTCGIVKKEANAEAKVGQQLTNVGRGVDFLVLWLDCDKEGENICFEVMEFVVPVMKIRPKLERVFRAQFSALTENDVRKSLENLKFPNKNESFSVDARMELDLRIGCAFTRFQTRFFVRKYGKEALNTTTIPFGPCQTPTLSFCVERHMKIQNFQPQPFWRIAVEVEIPGGATVSLDWRRNRTFDRNEAEKILQNLKRHRQIRVTNVTAEEKRKLRPTALNTVQLLRLASSQLRMSPSETMELAEKLYMEGFISYPRTETTQYPSSFDPVSTLTAISGQDEIGQYAAKLILEMPDNRRTGQDRGDHPPIIPLKKATSNLMKNQRSHELFQLICVYFLAGISDDCVFLENFVFFDVEEEIFQCDGVEILDPGFTEILKFQRIRVRTVPRMPTGMLVTVRNCTIKEDLTKPPEYLTESDLIDLMEQHGIGTDASIPVHIKNIFRRNFAVLNASRKIVPTPMGTALIGAYNALDEDLAKPQIRSTLEKDLVLIAEGKAKKDEIIKHVIEIYRAKYRFLVENVAVMDEAIANSLHLIPSQNFGGKSQINCGNNRRLTDNSRNSRVNKTATKRPAIEDRNAKRVNRQNGNFRWQIPKSENANANDEIISIGNVFPTVSQPPISLHPGRHGSSAVESRLLNFPSPNSSNRRETFSATSVMLSQDIGHQLYRPSTSYTVGNAANSAFSGTAAAAPLIFRSVESSLFVQNESLCPSRSFPTGGSSLEKATPNRPVVKVEAYVRNPRNLVDRTESESQMNVRGSLVCFQEGHTQPLPSLSQQNSTNSFRPNLISNCPGLKGFSTEGKDPVQAVHEISSKAKIDGPIFNCILESGPPHCREFVYELLIDSHRFGPFTGSTKKDAMKGVSKLCLLAFGFAV